MNKIINFYFRAFFIISFISLPFIFIAFPDLKKNQFTYRLWTSSFFPQFIYVIYLFKKHEFTQSFKQKFAFKNSYFNIVSVVIWLFIPWLIYFILDHFDLIVVYQYYSWNTEFIPIFFLLLLSAFLEEVLFRFIPYQLLGHDITIKKVILISLFFSIFHLFNPHISFIGFINIIAAGVFFSLIYLKSNSIILATIIHGLWNFSIGCFIGSNISGIKIASMIKYIPQKPMMLSGGSFGFEGSIMTTIVFFSYSIFLYYSMNKTKKME